MKKIIIFFVVVLKLTSVDAQTLCRVPLRKEDIPPKFIEGKGYIGGNLLYLKYISENIVLPKIVIDGKAGGDVWINVNIDINGKPISYDVDLFVDNCSECTREALRLIKSIKKFVPPISNMSHGKISYSPTQYTLSVGFHKNRKPYFTGEP